MSILELNVYAPFLVLESVARHCKVLFSFTCNTVCSDASMKPRMLLNDGPAADVDASFSHHERTVSTKLFTKCMLNVYTISIFGSTVMHALIHDT